MMGEIPARQVFSQKDFVKPLGPYYLIVNSVKQGDLDQFKKIVTKYQKLFQADKNLTLI